MSADMEDTWTKNGADEHAAENLEFLNLESCDSLSLYKVESQILDLYDQLDELRLETAIFEAQSKLPFVNDSQSGGGNIEQQIEAYEKDYLEARAAYLLKHSIVQNILITDPVLKAVHSGNNATPAERLLHPIIDRRDALGLADSELSAKVYSSQKNLTLLEARNIAATEKNEELKTTLVELVRQREERRLSAIQDANLSKQRRKVETSTITAKKRWRIMKSFVAAIIVGSGVDWAQDEELKQLVLDEEE